MEIHNWIMDLHIMDLHNYGQFMEIHNYIYGSP